MKKIIALLVVTAIVVSLCAACGKSSSESSTAAENDQSSTAASDAQETADEAESTPDASGETEEAAEPDAAESEPAGLQAGDTGDGPAELDAGLIKFTLPEGYSYEVNSIYIDEDDPLAGNLWIFLTEADASSSIAAVKVVATTMDMSAGHEDAVQKTIDLCNLQTYKEGKYTIVGDVTGGENTYTQVDVTTEYSNETYYVTYAETGNSYGTGLHVTVKVDNTMIESDDPLIKAVLDSIQIVKK